MTTPRTQSIENRTIPIRMGSAALIIFSTITTVGSVMATYYNLKADIQMVAAKNDLQTQITNVRLQSLEHSLTEDHEFLRTLSARLRDIEKQEGIKVDQQQSNNHNNK